LAAVAGWFLRLGLAADTTNKAIDETDGAWDFFAAHSIL
jgi:hypothetical protein